MLTRTLMPTQGVECAAEGVPVPEMTLREVYLEYCETLTHPSGT